MQEIKFLFHPYRIEDTLHVLEKSENGKKRRYLKGIASGMATDGHGERLTQNCVKSLQQQTNSGDILLYADAHGIKGTDDIGLLNKSEVSPTGDWIIEARLYDEFDGVGQNTLERADKLWRQINGLPPYKYPKQKGFSIEGFVPDDGIIEMSSDGKRVIDNVILDGVVTVPRPAYKTSVANAVYKALGETPPWQIEKTANIFKSLIATEETQNNYYKKVFSYQDTLETEIENIMLNESIKDKKQSLTALFDGYRDSMMELIVESTEIFQHTKPSGDFQQIEVIKSMDKIEVLKSLSSNLDTIIKTLN